MLRPARPGVDQDVGGLDVAVHQPGLMRGVERGRDRGDERHRPPGGLAALTADQRVQVLADHEAHRDVLVAVGLAGRVDRDDVRVVHRRHRQRLAREPLPDGLIPGQQLERHPPSEPDVAGAEHRRHPADPRQLLDQVPGHPGTGREPG